MSTKSARCFTLQSLSKAFSLGEEGGPWGQTHGPLPPTTCRKSNGPKLGLTYVGAVEMVDRGLGQHGVVFFSREPVSRVP